MRKSICFGSYPQSKVLDNTLISKLNELIGTLPTESNSGLWTSYKYYIEGSNSTDFMWYLDVTYNNEKYRGVYFIKYRPNWCRWTPDYNGYCTNQDDNGYKINTIYWFKFEPIQWSVLEDNNGDKFVVSKKILDSQQYYHEIYSKIKSRAPYDSTTKKSVCANNYKYSDIRGWLNTNFYNTAFTSMEQNVIKTTEVDNSLSSTGDAYNPYVCETTKDKVFLLSKEEVQNAKYFSENNERKVFATDYAKCQGTFENDDFNSKSYYLLRSSCCYFSYDAYHVRGSGIMFNPVEYAQHGTRPAFHLNLE